MHFASKLYQSMQRGYTLSRHTQLKQHSRTFPKHLAVCAALSASTEFNKHPQRFQRHSFCSSKGLASVILCSAAITETNIGLKVFIYLPLTLTDFPPVAVFAAIEC